MIKLKNLAQDYPIIQSFLVNNSDASISLKNNDIDIETSRKN